MMVWGEEHKFWNIRYKRKHNVQMFLTKKSYERETYSNKRNRQSNERIAFPPGSET